MDPEFRIMYNRSCEVWHLLSSVLSVMPKLGRKVKSQFYSAQQRFYRQMLMAAKVLSYKSNQLGLVSQQGKSSVLPLAHWQSQSMSKAWI